MTPGRPSSGPGAVFVAIRTARSAAFALAALLAVAGPAGAAPVSNPVATFSGLDKITARLTNFDVYINETVQFGSLQITPRVCYTEPADEAQRTSVFVEVDQVTLKGTSKRVFTGWMFADSPALNAVDNPVYDFWLIDCKQHTNLPPPTAINPVPGPVPVEAPEDGSAPPAQDMTATAPDAPDGPPPAPDDEAAPPDPPPVADPAASADPAPNQAEHGSIITLLNPNPTAETSPDVGPADR